MRQRYIWASLAAGEKGPRIMSATYTAVFTQDAECWIGWIEEVQGVHCQESTRGELVESLHVVLREALELNRSGADGDYEEFEIAV